VLIGAAGFFVSCFLPLYGGAPTGPQSGISLYRLEVTSFPGESLSAQIGGLLTLFGGMAIVTWIAILGFRRVAAWTLPAMTAATAVWSLGWFGLLLRFAGLQISLSIGYWVLLLSVGVALGGAILAVVSSRPRGGVVVGADD
jgi:hypothetical protein